MTEICVMIIVSLVFAGLLGTLSHLRKVRDELRRMNGERKEK